MSELYKADGTPIHVGQDGTPRKTRYGMGKQPWDYMVKLGWAPHFAAGNVLKYLRREKDREHSIESARWYYARLTEEAIAGAYEWDTARLQLNALLTDEEKALLHGTTADNIGPGINQCLLRDEAERISLEDRERAWEESERYRTNDDQ